MVVLVREDTSDPIDKALLGFFPFANQGKEQLCKGRQLKSGIGQFNYQSPFHVGIM